MLKIKDLLGLPVLETDSGTQIGEVQEVVVDMDQAAVRGIIIESSSWVSGERGIDFTHLHTIGRDAVMIRNKTAIQDIDEVFSCRQMLHRLKDLLDKPIYTESGLQLGLLADLDFEPATGEIKSYRVSDGVIIDLIYGRMRLPLPKIQVIGQDRVIVPDAMAELLQTQTELS